MEKFQFLLFTYWLQSLGFLKKVAPDVVRTVPLCGVAHSDPDGTW